MGDADAFEQGAATSAPTSPCRLSALPPLRLMLVLRLLRGFGAALALLFGVGVLLAAVGRRGQLRLGGGRGVGGVGGALALARTFRPGLAVGRLRLRRLRR